MNFADLSTASYFMDVDILTFSKCKEPTWSISKTVKGKYRFMAAVFKELGVTVVVIACILYSLKQSVWAG